MDEKETNSLSDGIKKPSFEQAHIGVPKSDKQIYGGFEMTFQDRCFLCSGHVGGPIHVFAANLLG